jgi:glycosyltransferase involved in cell wall biosynthesis
VVSDDDRVAIWAGGLWSWFDPLTAIRAVERLRPRRPDLKLALVGYEYPVAAGRRAHERSLREALDYVRDRDLAPAVLLKPEWQPRDDYFDHLLEADVGVSLNHPTLEGRFASRTRVLDYLQAGLPVVCTRGDAMADLVTAAGAGLVIGPHDVDGCAAALDRLTTGAPWRIDRDALLEPLRWHNAARPLVEFCRDPGPARVPSRRELAALAVRSYPAFLAAVHRNEPRGLLRALARSAARPLRR